MFYTEMDDLVMEPAPTMSQLSEFVLPKIAVDWEQVALALHFDDGELLRFNRECRYTSVGDCCVAMLRYWKRNTTNATADQLINAIKKSGNGYTASKLRQGWPYECLKYVHASSKSVLGTYISSVSIEISRGFRINMSLVCLVFTKYHGNIHHIYA